MNWLRRSRSIPPVALEDTESLVDEYGRKLLYGLIASGTAIAASFDPQLESIEPVLLPVGSISAIGFAVAGLRHVVGLRTFKRLNSDES